MTPKKLTFQLKQLSKQQLADLKQRVMPGCGSSSAGMLVDEDEDDNDWHEVSAEKDIGAAKGSPRSTATADSFVDAASMVDAVTGPLGLTAEERLLLGSSDDDNDNDRSAYAPKTNTDKLFAMSKSDLVALTQKLIAAHRAQRSASKALAAQQDNASSAASEAENAVAAAQEAAAIEKAELEAQIAVVKDEHTTATAKLCLLEAEASEYAQSNEEMKDRISELESGQDDTDEMDLLQSSLSDLKEKLAAAVAENTSLNDELEGAMTKAKAAEVTSEELQREVNDAALSQSTFAMELASLQAELATAQAEEMAAQVAASKAVSSQALSENIDEQKSVQLREELAELRSELAAARAAATAASETAAAASAGESVPSGGDEVDIPTLEASPRTRRQRTSVKRMDSGVGEGEEVVNANDSAELQVLKTALESAQTELEAKEAALQEAHAATEAAQAAAKAAENLARAAQATAAEVSAAAETSPAISGADEENGRVSELRIELAESNSALQQQQAAAAEAHRALEAAEKQSMDVLADANQAKKRLAELQESHGEASQDSEGFTQAHVDELLEAARAAERVSATEAMDEAVSAAREAALGSVRTEVETLENEVASATKSKKQVEIVLSKANMKLKKEVDTLNAQNKKLGGQVQVLVKAVKKQQLEARNRDAASKAALASAKEEAEAATAAAVAARAEAAEAVEADSETDRSGATSPSSTTSAEVQPQSPTGNTLFAEDYVHDHREHLLDGEDDNAVFMAEAVALNKHAFNKIAMVGSTRVPHQVRAFVDKDSGRARDAPFVAPCFESERMFESNGDDEEHADFSDQPSPGGGRDELDDVRLGSTSPSGGGEKNKKKFNFKQFMEKSKETILHNVDQAKKIADRVILETKLTHVGVVCNNCKNRPIVGTRWKCMMCKNYSLCSICYRSGAHGQEDHLPNAGASISAFNHPKVEKLLGALAKYDKNKMMKLRHWLEQVATVPMSALPFNKLEMPQLPADVVVGFNTLLLPVLQSNTLSRGHKPAQQTLLAWFPEKKQGTEAIQSFFKTGPKDEKEEHLWRLRVAVVPCD
eukprot:INCI14503.1.p1 GENE.INCI14503.1~~INCI14503.1.p1  ORF type:complete len:1061 (-),score=309.85 INCI14503.1:30-3212(-)